MPKRQRPTDHFAGKNIAKCCFINNCNIIQCFYSLHNRTLWQTDFFILPQQPDSPKRCIVSPIFPCEVGEIIRTLVWAHKPLRHCKIIRGVLDTCVCRKIHVNVYTQVHTCLWHLFPLLRQGGCAEGDLWHGGWSRTHGRGSIWGCRPNLEPTFRSAVCEVKPQFKTATLTLSLR